MTRLGDLLHFLKPLATINLPKYPMFLGNLSIGVKIILGNFYRYLAIFSGHTGWNRNSSQALAVAAKRHVNGCREAAKCSPNCKCTLSMMTEKTRAWLNA